MSGKSIAKNSVYNMFYKGFSVLFPLITIGYIDRALLAESVGKVDYARTIVTYFTTTAALGIPNYGVKAIAQTGSDLNKRSQAFWNMFYINAISTVICTLLYYLFVALFPYLSDRRALFYVMGSMVILNVINIDWYYQGIEEYGYITARSIAVKVFSFILMLKFVKTPQDYLGYAAILCFATAGNNLFNIINLRTHIKFFSIKECQLLSHLKPVLMFLGVTLATEIYTMLDTLILEYQKGEAVVAYYSNSVKIIRLVYTMSIAMVATMYPRISYYIKMNRIEDSNILLSKGLKSLLLLALPCAVGVFITANSIVYVVCGEAFSPAILCLRILSVLIVVFSIAYLLGHIILMSSGNEKRILIATIIGAAVNATLNIILIPVFSHYGAAVASVVAEIIVTVVLIAKAKKYFHIQIGRNYIITTIGALAIMAISISLIGLLGLPHVVNLIICVLVGCLMYSFSLIVFKNDTVLSLINMVKNKFNSKKA